MFSVCIAHDVLGLFSCALEVADLTTGLSGAHVMMCECCNSLNPGQMMMLNQIVGLRESGLTCPFVAS